MSIPRQLIPQNSLNDPFTAMIQIPFKKWNRILIRMLIRTTDKIVLFVANEISHPSNNSSFEVLSLIIIIIIIIIITA